MVPGSPVPFLILVRSANFLVLVPGIPAQSATKVADSSPSGSPCSNQLRPDGLASWTAIAWALLSKQPLAEFVWLFGCGRIKVGAYKWSCGLRGIGVGRAPSLNFNDKHYKRTRAFLFSSFCYIPQLLRSTSTQLPLWPA